MRTLRAIRWQEDTLVLLDQRRLPHEEHYLRLHDARQVADAIQQMVVRGAPAIGITAAYGVVLSASRALEQAPARWRERVLADMELLAAARPTAVNLAWALDLMRQHLAHPEQDPVPTLLAAAHRVAQDDLRANQRMGDFGAALIQGTGPVLTHCNTGSLATGGHGTALGVVRSLYAQGRLTRVFVDETRPWLQGARLTAWELARDGIPATLIVDGAAAWAIRRHGIPWVVVGADRIAANGDTANKIGTYGLAVLARHHGARLMVVAPTSTIDFSLSSGEHIPVEMRDPQEVLRLQGQPVAAEGTEAWNPAFDVTPAALIHAIVTERGVVEHPDAGSMKLLGNPIP